MKHWISLLLAILPSLGFSQPIDLYCEIEGNGFLNELKKTHPGAATLVFQVDPKNQSIKNTGGIFATDPILSSEWHAFQIQANQSYPQLIGVNELQGYRVIRIDRTTGNFTVTDEVRRANGQTLSQTEVDAALDKAGKPDHWLFRPRLGLSASGQCETRKKIF